MWSRAVSAARTLALLWLVLVCGAGALQAQAASRASASLDRPVIALGDVAELTINIVGDDARPVMPQIAGLHITLVGQDVSSQFSNTGSSTVFSRIYQVTGEREGDFNIAPISVDGVQLPPLRLKVSAAAAGAAAAGGAGQAQGAGARDAAPGDARRILPFMRVVLPRSRLYVGEQVPIQIKGYFREGTEARMEGALAVNGDAFTASRLDEKPERSEENIGGINWTVLTWTSVLGAIKAGDYPLNIELPLTVRYRTGGDSAMAERLRQLFNTGSPDAFMGEDLDSIFGRIQERQVTLRPEGVSVKVLPLPPGQPADFSGAVGHFALTAGVTPAAGREGDPLTLKITVSGTGNFSRVNLPGLAESPQWRTYRPAAEVAADKDLGLTGSKTFTQPIVPKQAGLLQVPAIGFSWFDPDTGRYESRRTGALDVTVSPAAAVATAAAAATAGRPAPAAARVAPASAPLPAPVTGRATRSLRPLIRQPWFAGVLAAPVLALLLLLVWLALRAQARRRQPREPLRRLLVRMDAALAQGDAAGFFAAARAALEERAAADGGSARQAILQAADRVAYGRGSMSQAELRQWRQAVVDELRGGKDELRAGKAA